VDLPGAGRNLVEKEAAVLRVELFSLAGAAPRSARAGGETHDHTAARRAVRVERDLEIGDGLAARRVQDAPRDAPLSRYDELDALRRRRHRLTAGAGTVRPQHQQVVGLARVQAVDREEAVRPRGAAAATPQAAQRAVASGLGANLDEIAFGGLAARVDNEAAD